MALNFPNSPTVGQIYTDSTSGFSYQWNGTLWSSYSAATSTEIREVDDISGSFNGITTSFALTSSGANISPTNAQQLIVSIGGVIQNPGQDYSISGSNIIFSTAPTAGLDFFATSFGPAQNIGVPGDGTVTPVKLSTGGPVWNTSGGLVVTGIATFSSNVSIAGTLTYEDVTNVDSIGIVTARSGLIVGTGGTVITTTTSGNVGINSTVPQTKLDVVGGIKGTLVLDTAKSASGLGTAVDFTGIPSWVKRITVMFGGVSTNGTSQPMLQLGDSGGIETTGYATYSTSITSGANAASAYTNGWQLYSGAAVRLIEGNIVFSLLNASTNTWSGVGNFANDSPGLLFSSGSKSLSATLDRVRITTDNGTDTFDAGTINIMYEG